MRGQSCNALEEPSLALVNMPEEQPQEDVKKEVAAEVATPAAESSPNANDIQNADAVAVDNAESSDKPEERTFPLAQHIAERQKLKQKTREAEERAAKAEERVKALESASKQTNSEQGGKPAEQVYQGESDDWTPDKGKPTSASCGYDTELLTERMADWKLHQRDQSAKAERARGEANKQLSEFDQRAAEYAATNPDYDKFIQDRKDDRIGYGDPVINKAVLREGPFLDHFLGSEENAGKLDAVKAIADPTDRAFAIKDLVSEAKQWAAKKKGITKPITNAPTPVETVAGKGGKIPSDYRYDGSLTAAEYRARMNSE